MPSLLLATPHYHPESGAAARRTTAMAEHFAQNGWQVTVVTLLPHHPQNRIYSGYESVGSAEGSVNGVRVLRHRPWIVPKHNLTARLLSESLFSAQAFVEILRHPSQLVLASSPYMFLGPLGLLASRLCGARFLWDVRDLTWLYPRATGMRSLGLGTILERLMRFVAAQADGVVTATEGLLDYFAGHFRQGMVVPNGVTEEVLERLGALREQGRPQKGARPTVVYAGLLGYNHGLVTLIEAAEALPHANFVLAGDGPARAALEERVTSSALTNVRFVGHLAFDELVELYRQSDILVSHVRRNPIFLWTQPAKLWEYMATGRPVVHAGEGEVVEILERHDIARSVPPEDPIALGNALQELLDSPRDAEVLGRRGRAFVEEHRNRRLLLDDLESLAKRLLAEPGRGDGIAAEPNA